MSRKMQLYFLILLSILSVLIPIFLRIDVFCGIPQKGTIYYLPGCSTSDIIIPLMGKSIGWLLPIIGIFSLVFNLFLYFRNRKLYIKFFSVLIILLLLVYLPIYLFV